MADLGFNTSIKFSQKDDRIAWKGIGKAAEDYFYLGGKRAKILEKENNLDSTGKTKDLFVEIYKKDSPVSSLFKTIKIITYCTGVIPFVMVLLKLAFRTKNHFVISDCVDSIKPKIQKSLSLQNDPKILNTNQQTIESNFISISDYADSIKPEIQKSLSLQDDPKILNTNQQTIESNFISPLSETPNSYPIVENSLKKGFFVDVLNKGGYVINGKIVNIPPAGAPVKFSYPNETTFEEALEKLRSEYSINKTKEPTWQFKDQTTEEAINESNSFRIALNFANEHHAGGGPGFHKEKDSNLFIYDAPSARAQEESLCQRSDLMVSLTQLPHTLKPDSANSKFIRSYYDEKFDSTNMSYVSRNHLYAVQQKGSFYESSYLENPKAVAFVTSAAVCYRDENETVDCKKGSVAYEDAKRRIETHLLAAANESAIAKKEHPGQSTEVILGAFGCGAFAPQKNPDEYRDMVASIYKELLPQFHGFFDIVTFAVPTFGDNNPMNPAVANYQIFRKVLGF